MSARNYVVAFGLIILLLSILASINNEKSLSSSAVLVDTLAEDGEIKLKVDESVIAFGKRITVKRISGGKATVFVGRTGKLFDKDDELIIDNVLVKVLDVSDRVTLRVSEFKELMDFSEGYKFKLIVVGDSINLYRKEIQLKDVQGDKALVSVNGINKFFNEDDTYNIEGLPITVFDISSFGATIFVEKMKLLDLHGGQSVFIEGHSIGLVEAYTKNKDRALVAVDGIERELSLGYPDVINGVYVRVEHVEDNYDANLDKVSLLVRVVE